MIDTMSKSALIQGERYTIESAITYVNKVSYYVKYKGRKSKLRLGLNSDFNHITYYILFNKNRINVTIEG